MARAMEDYWTTHANVRLEAIRAALQLEPTNTEDLIDCAREIEAYLSGKLEETGDK